MGPSHEAADYAVAYPAYPVRTPMIHIRVCQGTPGTPVDPPMIVFTSPINRNVTYRHPYVDCKIIIKNRKEVY
jgi:hypothetical protein